TGGCGKVVSGLQLGTDRTEELGEGRGPRTHVSAGQPSTLTPFEHATPFMYAPPPSRGRGHCRLSLPGTSPTPEQSVVRAPGGSGCPACAISELPGAARPHPRLLATLLNELPNEVLGVALQDVIDLVKDVVDVLVDLFIAFLGALGSLGLFDFLVTACSVLLASGVLGCHRSLPPVRGSRPYLGPTLGGSTPFPRPDIC